jgi:Flp pilus assembly protein TadG
MSILGRIALVRCDRGAVAIMAALVTVPILLAVGLGIDIARAYLLRNKLGYALDAAALAAGSEPGDIDAQRAIARKYFDANFTTSYGRVVSFDFQSDGRNIAVQGTARLDTTLMSLTGHDWMDVGAVSEVTRSQHGLELAMVLDNTGSMLTNDNIGTLRDAAELMTNILFGTETVHPHLRIALVPYSAAVNPGSVAPSLVAAGAAYAPADKAGWKGCVVERAAPNTNADTPASVAKWSRYSWASAVDNKYNLSNPSSILAAPSYGNGGTGPNLGCPTAITPLTSVKATVISAVHAMEAWSRGGTLGDIGMAWGLRVLSPGSPFSEGSSWGDPDWTKAAILMTDGNNEVYRLTSAAGPNNKNNSVNSDYTAYGRLDQYGMVGSTSITGAKVIIDNRLSAVCANMKSKGILVYTVTFTPGITADTKTIFRNCASDSKKYFDAPTQADLKAAFQAVANELSNLRITR